MHWRPVPWFSRHAERASSSGSARRGKTGDAKGSSPDRSEEVRWPIGALKEGNGWRPEPLEQRKPVPRESFAEETCPTGTDHKGPNRKGEVIMSTKLAKVVERAQRDPKLRFNSLAHLLDEDALKRAFGRIHRKAAVGVDGVTKEQYEQCLDENIQTLHERLRSGCYRHQPVRRAHIPKGFGKKGTRPIGVSCLEDKIVQGAIKEVLEVVFEPIFRDSSFGFRPHRSQHDALRTVDGLIHSEKTEWILELDFQAFFDSLLRPKLREMLQERVVDGALLRLIGKCLHVGVLDGEQFMTPKEGTVQGSVISPLLGNVYLHYVLDQWFELEVAPQLPGRAWLVRFADDAVLGFESKDDAERVRLWLEERTAKFGLTLHPEKTRLIPFQRPSREKKKGKGPATFDFLGFTLYWRRGRKRSWGLAMKTRTASFRKSLYKIRDWCRRHWHLPRREQHAALVRRLQGHYNYFGVNWNLRRLSAFRYQVTKAWLKCLQRRSQRGRRLTWERFNRYLSVFPLPPPRICVQIWARSP